MKIPALDLKKQIAFLRPKLDLAIKKIIDNTDFILGQEVGKFEENAAKYCGVKYAIAVSNGTDAISLSLLALGIKTGDAVICPAFTYYASAGAAANIGVRPVFADIDPDTYNICPESVKKILSGRNKNKIKAIIPVHLYGQCCNMEKILSLAEKFGLKVIEDAAQAFGADYLDESSSGRNAKYGRKAGTMGDCGCVSFYPGKNLGAFGDAGMVLTDNQIIAEKIRILRNQGNKDRYFHELLGRNNRMDTLQACVLDVKLKFLDLWNGQRRNVAEYYNRQLSGCDLKLPFNPDYTNHIYHQYTLSSSGPNQKIVAKLQEKGIDSRIFYPVPLHLQKCFKYLGYRKGDFAQAEKASKHVFTLPIYPELSGVQKEYIIKSLKEILNG